MGKFRIEPVNKKTRVDDVEERIINPKCKVNKIINLSTGILGVKTCDF